MVVVLVTLGTAIAGGAAAPATAAAADPMPTTPGGRVHDRPPPDEPVPDRSGPDLPVPDLPVPDPAVPDPAVAGRPVPDPALPPDPPPVAAADLGVRPRALALGPVATSRPVSAPPSDPMSLMERDAGLSVRLSDGSQLWLFADSALDLGSHWAWFSGNGTGALGGAADPYVLTEPWVLQGEHRVPASELIAGADFSCPVGLSPFTWPSSAIATPRAQGGDDVWIYYQSICGRGGDPGSYRNLAMGLARYVYDPRVPPSPTRPIRATVVEADLFPPMPGHSGPGAGYGVASASDGQFAYAYGCHYSPTWQACRVARTGLASIAVASSYRYWDGSAWVVDPDDAVDLDMPHALIGVKGSVTFLDDQDLWAMVDNDFPSPRVAVRYARHPEGPWTAPVFVDLPGCTGVDCWAAEVHGSLSRGGRLAITYFADGMRPGMRAISVPVVHEPFGAIEVVASGAPNRVVLWGWAVDPDVVDPVSLTVTVDGVPVASTSATGARPDVEAAFTGQVGGGFVTGIDVTPGRRTICVRGANLGPGAAFGTIGCRTVDVVPPRYGPVVATNGDGRLEVFAMDAFGALVHAWQVTPGGAWSSWEPVGLDPRSAPVVARNGDGRLEIFAVDRDGWLVHKWQIPGQGWGSWRPMGVQATGTAAVGTNVNGRLELFVAGTGGRLLHTRQAPPAGWTAFVDAGASAAHPPVMGASADGRLEVFVTSGDGGLLHSWQTRVNGSFSPWRYTGTFAHGPPDVERALDGRLELFATDHHGALVHQWQIVPNGPWSRWEPLGFQAANPPVATRNADGRLEAFVLASDLRIWHAWQDPRAGGGWSGWEPMGLVAWTEPAAAANLDGRLTLVALAGWGQLLQATQVPGVGWSTFRPITPGSP